MSLNIRVVTNTYLYLYLNTVKIVYLYLYLSFLKTIYLYLYLIAVFGCIWANTIKYNHKNALENWKLKTENDHSASPIH